MSVHRLRLVAFVLLALASGWVGLAVSRLVGEEPTMESLAALTWILLPPAAALGLGLTGDRGVLAALRPGPGRRGDRSGRGTAPSGVRSSRATAYAIALALFPMVAAATLGIGVATGRADLARWDLPRVLEQVAGALLPALVKNVAEEIAWRGYLTDQLLREGLPVALVDLIVGAVWSLWHLPYYLHLLGDEEIDEAAYRPRGLVAAVSVPVITAWAVPFTQLFRRTGSIWPTVLAHSLGNSIQVPLARSGVIRRDALSRAWLHPVFGAVPAALLAGAGVALRRP